MSSAPVKRRVAPVIPVFSEVNSHFAAPAEVTKPAKSKDDVHEEYYAATRVLKKLIHKLGDREETTPAEDAELQVAQDRVSKATKEHRGIFSEQFKGKTKTIEDLHDIEEARKRKVASKLSRQRLKEKKAEKQRLTLQRREKRIANALKKKWPGVFTHENGHKYHRVRETIERKGKEYVRLWTGKGTHE